MEEPVYLRPHIITASVQNGHLEKSVKNVSLATFLTLAIVFIEHPHPESIGQAPKIQV